MSATSVILRCPSCRTLNRVPVERLSSHPVCGACKAALRFPSSPINATAATFDREANDWPGPLLVEFWGPNCGYCRMVDPVVNDIAAWRAGRLKILKVNIESEAMLARQFDVLATPTFIFFNDGRQIARIDGAPQEKLDLLRWVDQHLPA